MTIVAIATARPAADELQGPGAPVSAGTEPEDKTVDGRHWHRHHGHGYGGYGIKLLYFYYDFI